MAERKFGARCPSAIGDFFARLSPPTESRNFRRARTVPSVTMGPVGQKSNPYRDSPRKIHLFETPTGRTVPGILVARMRLWSKSRGENGRPKFPRFRPVWSDQVGFVGRTGTLAGSLADQGRSADRPTTGSTRRMLERHFGARCPNAIRDFFARLGPPTDSRNFWRARTVPVRDHRWSTKRVTSIGTSRGILPSPQRRPGALSPKFWSRG
jgi:hypothetical protein